MTAVPLQIVRNDITKMRVDAIVNAAKQSLMGGGGVDGCIHRAAGPALRAECLLLGGCRVGDAKVTKGYRLPCKFVIHTVGPIWQGGWYGEEKLLASCYRNSLALAKSRGCESVAFPLISAGTFGYPKDQAMRVALDTIGEFLTNDDEMTVYLVVYGRDSYQTGTKLFSDIAEYIDDNYVAAHAAEVRGFETPDASMRRLPDMPPVAMRSASCAPEPVLRQSLPLSYRAVSHTLTDLLDGLDEGFSQTLLHLIDRSGKKDSEIYKKANVDRKLFSKIRNNPHYQPSKQTAIAFAIALELDMDETADFLARAGYALSHSSKFDVIVEFFIRRKQYDVFVINEALFAFDQSLLGL